MDLLDILLAKKLTSAEIGTGGGTGNNFELPEGGQEGSLLSKGPDGLTWTNLEELPFIKDDDFIIFNGGNSNE